MSNIQEDLHEDISQRVYRKLKDTFENQDIIQFFEGDPIGVGASQLPAISVELVQARSLRGPTGYDRWQENILIKIILNKKDDMNSDGNKNSTYLRLKQYIFARDKTTKQYLDSSIMGMIRKNFTLDSVVVNQEVTVDFGVAERPQDVFTAEAHISFVADELIEIGTRT